MHFKQNKGQGITFEKNPYFGHEDVLYPPSSAHTIKNKNSFPDGESTPAAAVRAPNPNH